MIGREEELRQLAMAMSELQARRSECPIASQVPLPKQTLFYHSTAPIVIFKAGNRSGKTQAAVSKAISYMIGYFPWKVPNFRLIEDDKGNLRFPLRSEVPSSAWTKRLDGLPTALPARVLFITGLPIVRGLSIFQSKFLDLWPGRVAYKAYSGPLGTWVKIVIENGSTLYLGSALQDDLSWEGDAFDGVLIDEPIPRQCYLPLRRSTVDRRAQISWSLTPICDARIAWMVADLFVQDRALIDIISGCSYENVHLDKKALDDFFNDPTFTEDERRARRDGDVALLGRTIVSTWNDSFNRIPATEIEPGTPIIQVVDPHNARHPAVVWMACLGEARIVFAEYPQVDYYKTGVPVLTTRDLVAEWKRIEGKLVPTWRVCDPNFGVQHAKVLGRRFKSFQEEMAEHGMMFDTNVDNDLERGIRKLRDACKVNPASNRPGLLVMDHCHNTLQAMTLWSYKEGAGQTRTISEEYKDFSDAVRYGLMYECPLFLKSGGFSYLDTEDKNARSGGSSREQLEGDMHDPWHAWKGLR